MIIANVSLKVFNFFFFPKKVKKEPIARYRVSEICKQYIKPTKLDHYLIIFVIVFLLI